MAKHDADHEVDELASPVRNHGKINPMRLSPNTRTLMADLSRALREEPGLLRAQVTFSDLHGDIGGFDDPPTVHVILAPNGNPEYWLEK